MKKESRKKFLVISVIGILYFVIVMKYKIGIPCIFHEVTGFYCPGCGISRAIISFLKMDFYQAFRYNMVIFILIPFFIIYLSLKEKKKMPNYVWYILVAIVVVFGVLRNIPEFSYLAPTVI